MGNYFSTDGADGFIPTRIQNIIHGMVPAGAFVFQTPGQYSINMQIDYNYNRGFQYGRSEMPSASMSQESFHSPTGYGYNPGDYYAQGTNGETLVRYV